MSSADVTRPFGARRTGKSLLAFDGRFRVAFVLFGGMLALQSSSTLDATKIAYLVGTVVCLAGALAAVWRIRRTPDVRRAVPWIATSAALAVVIAISFLVARANGTSITDWLRDAAAYALFAGLPVFALDGRASASRKLLVTMLVVAGLLGGISWAVEWLNRRDILDLPFARLVFPSGQLPGMLYLFAMATALTAGRRAGMWIVLAGVTLGLFLVTGTRSSLLLLIPPLAMAILAGRARIRSSMRTFVLHGLVAAAVVLVFQLAVALPAVLGLGRTVGEPGSSSPGPNVLGDRFGSMPGLLGSPTTDGSFKERVAQYEAAWKLFVSSPIVGVGPGHSIDWVDVSGNPRTGFTADTPLVMPAKFGLVGILVFVGAAVAYGSSVRAALRRDRRSAITLTFVGFGVLLIVTLPLGFLIEDKGASLALMLLLALAFMDQSGKGSPADEAGAAVG
jgi:O-antigen ligase/polysaccharide polymerase Wzy-like membrane protein